MKKALSILIVIAMTLSLVSCDLLDQYNVEKRDDNAGISFGWWGNDERSSYTIDGIRTFEKKYNIDVHEKFGEFAGYKLNLDTDVNADAICDVMQMHYTWLYEYTSQGYEFYDLYELKDKIKLENFSEDQLKLGEINGKLMGIPTSFNGISFFYNENTLKRYGFSAPKTWDELFALGERLKSDGIYAVEMAETAIWQTCAAYTEQATGKPMFDSSGRMQYTSTEFGVMLEFCKKLIDCNVTPRPSSFNHMDFYNGRAAGIACWTSESKSYFSSNFGADADPVSITLGSSPVISDDKCGGWYKKPMALYCIRKNTQNPGKAAQLVDFLLNSEEMAVLQGTEKGIPLSRSAQEVLESRDMLSDLQAVADRKMNLNSHIGIMSPWLENEELRKAVISAGDEVIYNHAGAYEQGMKVYSAAKSIKSIRM